MENLFINANPDNVRELKELLPADKYNIVSLANPTEAQGSVQVLRITCKLYRSPSLLDRSFEFLCKDGIYPVVSRAGNFAQLEGGGYVYLDNVNCKLIN